MHRSFILIPGFLLISTIALGFNQPTDVALDRKGNIYVADGYGNSRVLKFDKYGNPLMGWGMKGTGPGQFDLPHTIVIDGDMVYVGDRENARIQIFDTSGRYLREWRLGHPFGLVITLDHSIYMADAIAGCILKIDHDGKVVGVFRGPEPDWGPHFDPHQIAVDKDGSIFSAEVLGSRPEIPFSFSSRVVLQGRALCWSSRLRPCCRFSSRPLHSR
ncbi:MAG: hypothetical protein DMG35_03200 [Acidobacteria bacterium]|nr:MAG: hypothetical protein DMG35_03200 [Acidobacteriota bacterium]